MGPISRHQLLITSGADAHTDTQTHTHTYTHTDTHADIHTETILRNQTCAGMWPARAWFNKAENNFELVAL